jgi:hypothetical protein
VENRRFDISSLFAGTFVYRNSVSYPLQIAAAVARACIKPTAKGKVTVPESTLKIQKWGNGKPVAADKA